MAMLLLRLVMVSAVFGVETTSRRLSDLIFPKGTTFVVDMSQGVFLPEDVAKGFAQVVEVDLVYPIVEKAMGKQPPPKTIWMNPMIPYRMESEWFRRNEIIKDRQRKSLRGQLERVIDQFGFDGRRCVLRFQCELNTITKPETFLEDVILILFKRRNLDCYGSDSFCPFSLLHIILNSKYVNGTLY